MRRSVLGADVGFGVISPGDMVRHKNGAVGEVVNVWDEWFWNPGDASTATYKISCSVRWKTGYVQEHIDLRMVRPVDVVTLLGSLEGED